jgi:hypothetical protein
MALNPDPRISVHDRLYAIDNIAWLAREYNRWAAWLSEVGFEDEADDLQDGAHRGMSVVGRMSRPLLPKLPPEKWAG